MQISMTISQCKIIIFFVDETNVDFPQLIERGIRNLHAVYDGFKIRAKSSKCDLEKIMNSAYHKFHDM